MALTKDKKNEVVAEIGQLLADSKLTVVTAYQGTPVKALQQLRQQARDNGTTVQVVKNRLVIKALKSTDNLKDVDISALNGMLLYAFNSEDEVAPAQVIANFAKTQPSLQFVGAITADGNFISTDDVKALASLPSKDQLRGMLVGTLAAPLSGFVNVVSGNVRGVLQVLNARAQSLN
ncbi:MAG TPA: 50S ribosomal protein L10 [Candidatus Saccharimonadales bacterium]|nr:50S ribosomal protein L10 [Candidatus Saccharimonadales bacterium]